MRDEALGGVPGPRLKRVRPLSSGPTLGSFDADALNATAGSVAPRGVSLSRGGDGDDPERESGGDDGHRDATSDHFVFHL